MNTIWRVSLSSFRMTLFNSGMSPHGSRMSLLFWRSTWLTQEYSKIQNVPHNLQHEPRQQQNEPSSHPHEPPLLQNKLLCLQNGLIRAHGSRLSLRGSSRRHSSRMSLYTVQIKIGAYKLLILIDEFSEMWFFELFWNRQNFGFFCLQSCLHGQE